MLENLIIFAQTVSQVRKGHGCTFKKSFILVNVLTNVGTREVRFAFCQKKNTFSIAPGMCNAPVICNHGPPTYGEG